MSVLEIYQKLFHAFGPQNWWPVENGFQPKEWEICVGAILTQNTNWGNVEKALKRMKEGGCVRVEDVVKISLKELEYLIKPSGFYKQKARRLKEFAGVIKNSENLKRFLQNVKRKELLKIKGIGQETADSILLYAGNRKFFVVDAYTRRIFSRLGKIQENQGYEEIRKFFEKNLPNDLKIYKEFHALIVRLGKEFCRKNPQCERCPLKEICRYKKNRP